jgi:2-dehydro-3-deoxyphosphogluconate aldolase / (4S)-4-hydroxy-2-oxoglutarate aldolase
MNNETIRSRIEQIGIIPAIRLSSPEDALFAVEAVSESGIPIAEVTMTTPGAIEVIAGLTRTKPDLIVGAGTVIDIETARRCLDAGAKFLTSPGLDIEVVEFAVKHNVVVFPGALIPTDIMAAWKAGSDAQDTVPTHAIDCLWGRDPRERRRFLPGGSCRGGNWPGLDQSRGCPEA